MVSSYPYSAPSPPNSIKEECEHDDTEIHDTTDLHDASDIQSRLVLALGAESNFYQQASPEPTSPEDFDRSSQSLSPSPDLLATEEKKPVKKRKSWGQQLPTPTTNLPPRKRAKTEAEKEQRRVERVLRNRLAAQTSRERKRKEMEALEEKKLLVEKENEDLNKEVLQLRQENESLNSRMSVMEETIETLKLALQQKTLDQTQQFGNPLDCLSQDCLRPSYRTTTNTESQTLDPNNTQYDDEFNVGLENHIGLTRAVEELPTLCSTQHPAAVLCSLEDLQCLTRSGPTPSQTGLDVICWILGNFILMCFSPETNQLTELSTLIKAWTSTLETWLNQPPSLEQLLPSGITLAHLLLVATGYVSRNQICEKFSDLGKSASKELKNVLKADVFLGHSPTISPTTMKSVDFVGY